MFTSILTSFEVYLGVITSPQIGKRILSGEEVGVGAYIAGMEREEGLGGELSVPLGSFSRGEKGLFLFTCTAYGDGLMVSASSLALSPCEICIHAEREEIAFRRWPRQ